MSSNMLKMVRESFTRYCNMNGGMMLGLKEMEFVSVTEKTVTSEFLVNSEMANPNGNLHGGATATIADVVSTIGLICGPGKNPGVSVNLNVNYVKGAKIGERIVVESTTVKLGKTLAFLDIKLTKKETGEVVATASHTKHLPEKLPKGYV